MNLDPDFYFETVKMSRLFRSSSSVSNRSTLPPVPDIVNQEEHSYENLSQVLHNWNIPRVSPREIYQSTFSDKFKTDYNVKTVERVYAINKEYENCSLLSPDVIKKHRKKGYNFIHIGLVQVAVKPLNRKGIDSSIYLCLRDARFLNYYPSMIGALEASLHNGPIHFNCFPDFTLSLSDQNLFKALTLNIKTDGEITQMIEGSQPIALIYRIYYKTMKSNLNVHALNKSPKDQTVLIQSSTNDANIQIPRTILWKDITLPSQWTLPNELPQRPISNTSLNLENIKQFSDGTVKISFERNRTPVIIEDISSSSTPSVIHTRRDSEVLNNPLIKDIKLKGIINQGQVSHPCYTQNESVDDEGSSSPTSSIYPTQSDINVPIPHQLRVIKKNFKLDWDNLAKDFNSKSNKEKRHLFRANHPTEKERDKIINRWKRFIKNNEINITFYDWYEQYQNKCNVISKTQWIKEDRSKVSSSHPPIETVLIPVKETSVIASPFKIANGINDDKKIIEQLNFSNQYLATVGKQLDRIEEKFEESIIKIPDLKIEKPLITLPENRYGLGLPNKDEELVHTIDKLFKKLKTEPGPSGTIATIDQVEKNSNEEDSSSSEAESTTKLIDQLNKLTVQNTSLTRNWYSRPTPPDLQFEERNLDKQFSVSANKIYEWNIDGFSEQEILNKLNHMSMVANSYISKFNNLSQSDIVELLASGFTGILRSWWEKHLTEDIRVSIIHAIQRDDDGNPIFNEELGVGAPDGVNTLIFTIIKHFVGTPSNITERIHDQLSNLTCPTLSDFRWYKDVFTSRVMMRNDSNKPFWKEKFVNGLPSLFAHKVREELSKNLGYIDYDNLTYGDIISYIQKIGLKMCIDFKLAKQASKDKKKAKYELGTFCEQYGLPPVAPSRRKHRHSSKHIESHKTHRRKKRKYIYTDKNSKEIPDKKSKSTRKKSYKKSTKYDKSKIVCHNCGQKGHYKNECRVKKKLSQMNVSAEDTEEILELMRIEQESSNNEDISNAETSNYDTDSNDESNSDNEVTICTANCNNEDCCKTVNVINKDDEESSLLIELISKITDPSLKTQYLK